MLTREPAPHQGFISMLLMWIHPTCNPPDPGFHVSTASDDTWIPLFYTPSFPGCPVSAATATTHLGDCTPSPSTPSFPASESQHQCPPKSPLDHSQEVLVWQDPSSGSYSLQPVRGAKHSRTSQGTFLQKALPSRLGEVAYSPSPQNKQKVKWNETEEYA